MKVEGIDGRGSVTGAGTLGGGRQGVGQAGVGRAKGNILKQGQGTRGDYDRGRGL